MVSLLGILSETSVVRSHWGTISEVDYSSGAAEPMDKALINGVQG